MTVFASPERIDRVIEALRPVNVDAMGTGAASVMADAGDSSSDLMPPPAAPC